MGEPWYRGWGYCEYAGNHRIGSEGHYRHYEKWGSYTAELEGVFREYLVQTLHFHTEEKHRNQRAE